jgi:hypothetical protein
METILDQLEVRKGVKDDEYAKLLQESGFAKVSPKYPVINPKAIQEYLTKQFLKLHENEITEKDKRLGSVQFRNQWDEIWVGESVRHYVGNYYVVWGTWNNSSDKFKALRWKERDISEYGGYPPKHVLENVIKAKSEHFDRIKVVTIEEESVPKIIDPLVVGIKFGSENRHLIDWWDTDIDITEINMEK